MMGWLLRVSFMREGETRDTLPEMPRWSETGASLNNLMLKRCDFPLSLGQIY